MSHYTLLTLLQGGDLDSPHPVLQSFLTHRFTAYLYTSLFPGLLVCLTIACPTSSPHPCEAHLPTSPPHSPFHHLVAYFNASLSTSLPFLPTPSPHYLISYLLAYPHYCSPPSLTIPTPIHACLTPSPSPAVSGLPGHGSPAAPPAGRATSRSRPSVTDHYRAQVRRLLHMAARCSVVFILPTVGLMLRVGAVVPFSLSLHQAASMGF